MKEEGEREGRRRTDQMSRKENFSSPPHQWLGEGRGYRIHEIWTLSAECEPLHRRETRAKVGTNYTGKLEKGPFLG